MKLVRLAAVALVLGTAIPIADASSIAHSRVAAGSCAASVPQSQVSSTRLVAANTDFGFRLFVNLLDGAGNGNVLMSPASASLALDMAYMGARGSTLADMAKTLGLSGLTSSQVKKQAAGLLAALARSDPKAKLAIANALWVRSGFALQKAFVNDAKRYYAARVAKLDFKSPTAPATINSWVSCATHRAIPSILKKISPDVALYLMDAVYFHGLWTYPFKPADTAKHTFTTGAGQTVQVPLMHQEADLPYYQGGNFQLVSLPYGSGRFSMVVLLPKAGVSLSSFRPRPTAASWQSWLGHLKSGVGILDLPRFSIAATMGLTSQLSSMGMASAFSRQANFLGICKQPCRLTDVRQKTFLNVYEKGTTAAAVTSIGVGPTAVRVPAFHIVVDHPFFLGIRDSQTGAILFLAAVNNPLG